MSELQHVPDGVASQPDGQVKRSLLIPGGGLRLSYAAGAIKSLFSSGLRFQHMDGTSGGALNLAMLLSGLSIDEVCDRWQSLNMHDTLAFLPFKQVVNLRGFTASGSAKAFRTKVFPHLGINIAKIHAATGLQATFNIGNFSKKLTEVVDHQDITEDFLIAGMSLPGVFPPVTINGQVYLDAGFVQDTNLLEAVKRGANELWLIWILANVPNYRAGLLNSYVQMLEMSANAALHKELAQIKDINQRISAGQTVYGHTEPIRLHLIKPAAPLPLDPDLYTGKVTHQQLIDMGSQDAAFYLSNHSQEGLAFEPYITVMTEKTLGIQFKETMAGGFSLGAQDPEQGERLGKRNGFELAMHAQVEIDDIDSFIEDPDHVGRLSGSIDFVQMENGMPAEKGVFNLFYPNDQPDMKLMVYELGFQFEGQDYYLAGKKEVRDDPGFDLWTDTTTLFTTLHKGTDKSAELVGAGILTLGVTDLLKLVSTVTVTNASSSADKVTTVAKFGKFFMGELWDSYVKSS